MTDYISRESAIAEVMRMVDEHSGDQFGGVMLHYTGIIAMLQTLPPYQCCDKESRKCMTEYISKQQIMSALDSFNDKVNGNKHFLAGIETAREIIENVSVGEIIANAPAADVVARDCFNRILQENDSLRAKLADS